jgi:hypothetical protein
MCLSLVCIWIMRVNNKNRFQNEPIVCCFEKCMSYPWNFFPRETGSQSIQSGSMNNGCPLR